MVKTRALSLLVAVSVAFSALVGPYRAAQAAFPIPLIPGAMLVFESGQLAASYGAAIVALGAALYAIKFPSVGSSEALEVRVNPKAPQKTPSGWTAGASGAAPVPPGTAGSSTEYKYIIGGNDGGYQATQAAACTATVALVGSGASNATVTGGNCWYYYPPNGGPVGVVNAGNVAPTTRSVCPAGYSLVSSTCTLTTPTSVPFPADNVGTLDATTTGTPSQPSRDPDNADGLPSNVAVGSGTVTVTGDNGSRSMTIATGGDGKVTVTTLAGRGDGTSDREVLVFGARNSGATNGGVELQGGYKDRVIGEGGSAQTGATPGTQVPAKDPCGLPGTAPCKLDETGVTDSAGAIIKGVAAVDSVNSAKDAAVAAQSSGDLSAFGAPKYEAPSSVPGGSIALPVGGSDDCTPPAITYRGQELTLSGICTVTQSAKPIFAWALTVLAGLYAWFSYARRPLGTIT